jgi:hypothetical protein
MLADPDTGQILHDFEGNSKLSHAIALNRVALGFPINEIQVIPWPRHHGYSTAEGRELNETARGFGDDPDDWYVSEQPVDVMKASEVWLSRSQSNPKLQREDWYLKDVHKMVSLCRTTKGAYIPPSWLSQEQAEIVAQYLQDRFGVRRGTIS